MNQLKNQNIWEPNGSTYQKWLDVANIAWMVSLTVYSVLKNYEWLPDYRVIWAVWLAALLHHVSTSIISVIYHRSATHGSVIIAPKISTAGDNLVQFVAWVNLAEWKPTHEYHHKHADKPHDPHSPHNDGLVMMAVDPFIRYNKRIQVMKKEWIINSALTNTPIQKLLFPVLTANAYIWSFGDMNALIGILASYGFLKWATWTVNWLWHNHPERRREYGKSFAQNVWWSQDKPIGKMKSIWLNFLTAWEHHHGNHHFRPKSADISLWWKSGFDIWFWYIQLLEKYWYAKIVSNFDWEWRRIVESK